MGILASQEIGRTVGDSNGEEICEQDIVDESQRGSYEALVNENIFLSSAHRTNWRTAGRAQFLAFGTSAQKDKG